MSRFVDKLAYRQRKDAFPVAEMVKCIVTNHHLEGAPRNDNNSKSTEDQTGLHSMHNWLASVADRHWGSQLSGLASAAGHVDLCQASENEAFWTARYSDV